METATTSSPDQPQPNPVKFDPAQYSLVILKPDAIKGNIWGAIMEQLAMFGQKPVMGRICVMTDANINDHYAAHVGKDFFPALAEFMKSGPSFIILMYGNWETCRKVCDGIRKAYETVNPANLMHASDSPEAVLREAKLWFPIIGLKT
jgi:nucleoside-diphosphate kinase